ncbi:hypothetical protein AK830_g8288 [Neonectria ditissima]|uniref:Deacetylase sirtuin-type domain-containing protein n=1 Tax=Neonectria ditissima TaxID=78410 RepID=A0A0P7BCT9_9HYPO|nr:hypothetical protein AK830_g8288 [Neonectria ditissima]
MPTTHVRPDSHEQLQGIANALLKARKVVVVTGAGISTNSGIPDFRSENGLYSLIQSQFDAAARQARQVEQAALQHDTHDKAGGYEIGRASKRRRLSCDTTSDPGTTSEEIQEEIQVQLDSPVQDEDDLVAKIEEEHLLPQRRVTRSLITPRTTRYSISVAQPTTSPLSSPPPEDLITPPTRFRTRYRSRLADVTIPPSSSPLSSPPPGLFDPFGPGSPLEDNSSRRSTSPSEVDSPPTNPISLSQVSTSGRNTLPNMKGKDLFDAAIWADPIRTSVFYTFATTLRQKVKDIKPTSSHRFISHLRDRGKLVRCYTQNIDQIEEKVGLTTSLKAGPGSRGRFSRRSTANMAQLAKMVEEASTITPSQGSEKTQHTSDSEPCQQSSQSDGTETPVQEPEQSSQESTKGPQKRREIPRSGVECVFLHGSLELLRCFLCGRVCSWDDEDRELETMSGQQPECPHCVGATTAREEKGKRALGVGKLRPDIVLYGEEHPNSHLISPIITHDLALSPDLLLILGTSLRVHGLKVMVREFAKAVHTKGGKVVFVNFTKPPESSWGDIIDYWIEWDCDAWVSDLQDKIPKLWKEPDPPKPKKKRESIALEDADKVEVKKPPPANPVALRDTKATGAYWTLKILNDLHRITGSHQPERRASISAPAPAPAPTPTIDSTPPQLEKTSRPRTRSRRPRKSAPGALERPKKPPSTLNPNHGRSRQKPKPVEPASPAKTRTPKKPPPVIEQTSSILDSVKSNPRLRKRKKIDGEEVVIPTVGKRRTAPDAYRPTPAELELPPLRPQPPSSTGSRYGKPMPLEPRSPPAGPLASISVNMRGAMAFHKKNAFFLDDPLVKSFQVPSWWQMNKGNKTIVDIFDKAAKMGSVGDNSTTELPVRGKPAASVFGSEMNKQFLFDPEWKNLNHGSFGTYPIAIRDKLRAYQDASEARPDPFIRYEYPKLLDESRRAVAKLLNAPEDGVVFVPNATVGVNTVFRNLVWNPDGKDVVVSFSTVYEACGKVADYLVDYYPGLLATHEIDITYPLEDAEILRRFRAAVGQLRAAGKRARVCIFDVVSSRPGVVFPWEAMIEACRELGVISMVDGAQGVGMVKLDLAAADPDFFVSNCHKWLFAPRGCAVMYTPQRNQHLLATTLATSHGYVPRKAGARISPLPPSSKPAFVSKFEFVGTLDNSPYLCVKDAIAWRADALGGEDAVLEYLWDLNRRGTQLVADGLGTVVMENAAGTLRNCAMGNVALPVWAGAKADGAAESDTVVPAAETGAAFQWILRTLISDHKTFLSLFIHGGRFWVRISAQVYLGLEDYEYATAALKDVCARVAKKEYL